MLADYALLLIGAMLVNNVVLAQLLGLCPFMGVSHKLETAMGMAVVTTVVLALAAAVNHLSYHYVLRPLGLEYLKTLAFMLVIAALVQCTAMALRQHRPLLHRALGVYLPLLASNCAVLGVALLNVDKSHRFIEALLYAFGTALGFSLVLILFTALRERIASADVPAPFRGAAIGMVTAGLMSLAFMGFAGLV